MVDNSSIYTNNYNNYNLFKLKRSCYQRLLRNFLKYSSILKVLKVHYKCCTMSQCITLQIIININSEADLGLLQSQRLIMTKSSTLDVAAVLDLPLQFIWSLHLKKLHERSALICLTYFNVIPTMFAEEGDDDGGRREGGGGLLWYGPILLSNDKTCYSYTLTKHYKLYVANNYFKDNPQKSYFDKVCKFLGKHQWQCSFLARL